MERQAAESQDALISIPRLVDSQWWQIDHKGFCSTTTRLLVKFYLDNDAMKNWTASDAKHKYLQ